MSVVQRFSAGIGQPFSLSIPVLMASSDPRDGGRALMTLRRLPDPSLPALLSPTWSSGSVVDNGDGSVTWTWIFTAAAADVGTIAGIVYFDVLYERGAVRRNVGRGTIDFVQQPAAES